MGRVCGALYVLVLSLATASCDNPAASKGGPFRLRVKTAAIDDYGGDNDATLRLNYNGEIMSWNSPLDGDPIIGAYVEVQFASQSTDLAYIPVLSWLRAKGDPNPGPIQVSRRNRGLVIDDPQGILVGETIAVSSPSSRFRATQLDTVEFVILRDNYVELEWPSFTSAVHFELSDVYMRAAWDGDDLERRGTYVGAWVKEFDDSGVPTLVPIDTWLFESDRYSPNNLYVSEISYYTRYRDRSFGLLGQTIVVAFVTSNE